MGSFLLLVEGLALGKDPAAMHSEADGDEDQFNKDLSKEQGQAKLGEGF